MFGIIARMRGMTGTAGSSLFRHIHVLVMKVHRSVSKGGQIIGVLEENHILVVTGKTEVIEGNVKWRIELRRIVSDQQPVIIASVRGMALRAFPLRHGAMNVSELFQFLLRAFMAREAELSLILNQKIFEVRAVAVMAFRAFAFGNGIVRSLYVFIHFMALFACLSDCRG